MKKFCFFWVAALLQVVLFSCKEENGLDNPDSVSGVVDFSISSISPAQQSNVSRATELEVDGLKVSGFRVSAYSTGTSNWTTAKATATPEFMHNQSVTWDTDKWTYSPVQSWPDLLDDTDSGGKVSFFAWSDVGELAVVSGDDATGAPALTVAVPHAQAGQKDLVADVAVDKTFSGGAVQFTMRHILSRIGFVATLDKQHTDKEVKITSLKVKYAANGVERKGVYTFGDTDEAAGAWTYPAAGDKVYMSHTGDEVVADPANGVTLDNSATPVTTRVNGTDGFLMLLPQEIASGAVQLEVALTVNGVANSRTLSVPRQVWLPGKTYDYELKVSPETVTLAPVMVDPWDDNPTLVFCKLTYKANGGTGADVVQQLVTNAAYPVDENMFTRRYYTFAGWNTQADGLGDDYAAGDNITLDGAMTLYAQWAPTEISDGMANCYIVIPGDKVSFSVMQAYVPNGNDFTNTLHVGGTYTGAFTAETLWDDNSVINTVSVSGAGNAAVVSVQTNSVSGNAVVAIKKGSDIVWSYHIWVTDYTGATTWTNPNQTAHTYTFMDRNLGATEAANSLAGRGLFYQWGRKDPFPGGAAGTAGYAALDKFYGISQTGAGSTTAVTVSSSNNADAIVESIQNPTTFYSKSSGDWLPGLDNYLWSTNGMASGSKTIYDPCPAGWRVPARTNISSDSDYYSPWNGVADSMSWKLGGADWGTNALYPAAGYRDDNYNYNGYSGRFNGGGSDGWYWSASRYYNYHSYASCLLFTSSGTVNVNSYGSRASGYSVRCVRE